MVQNFKPIQQIALEGQLRVTRENIARDLHQGASNEGWREQALANEFRLVRDLAHLRKDKTRLVLLTCGHERRVNVGSWEEADMDRTGTVRCTSTKPTILELTGNYPAHRGIYTAVAGWRES